MEVFNGGLDDPKLVVNDFDMLTMALVVVQFLKLGELLFDFIYLKRLGLTHFLV